MGNYGSFKEAVLAQAKLVVFLNIHYKTDLYCLSTRLFGYIVCVTTIDVCIGKSNKKDLLKKKNLQDFELILLLKQYLICSEYDVIIMLSVDRQ